ncbi:hypothetical protein GCM10007989_34630 [Devosia pacifica]|uniref:HTH araC/xylS-type domain-containing protein n=1 Tax=Devosia pacifica TaxID=1335967 RepID=A0A918SF55_9HYPH|nr:AraC family transcriptional regulator [Devosia pacifica]GHA35690.1 hypothetical protein GCM10007989_34630 [Devosia pacifica]
MNTEVFEMYRRPNFVVLPELGSLGMFVTSESRIGGERRDGPDGLELGYLESGSVEWWDGSTLDEARPGSILVDKPGDWQGGTNAIVHPCTRYWLRFNFPETGALEGLPLSTTEALSKAFRKIDRRHFPGSGKIRELFQGLLSEQRQPTQYSEDLARSLFHQVLIAVLRDHDWLKRRQISDATAHALAYLDEHSCQEIRVEDAARCAGLSTGYFHDLFLRETGMTPSRYHLQQRMGRAKQSLIKQDGTVTEIAMDLGFSSSQYFSTTFKKVVGLTPAQYRTLRRGQESSGVT